MESLPTEISGEEAAAIAKCGIASIHRAARKGLIHRTRARVRVTYSKDEIVAWAQSRNSKTDAQTAAEKE